MEVAIGVTESTSKHGQTVDIESRETSSRGKAQAVDNTFTRNPLDRINAARHDEATLKLAFEDPRSLFCLFHQLKPLMAELDTQIVWKTYKQLQDLIPEQELSALNKILLGKGHIRTFTNSDPLYFWAIDISSTKEEIFAGVGKFGEVRGLVARLHQEDAAVLGQARAILHWHTKTKFCSVCGHSTYSKQGGSKRACTNQECKSEHFPRTDPVAIMLVTRGTEVLLGRKKIFPTGMYSTLAGFIETGESIEEAVRREVLEESGIKVGAVHYHSSQPWPFPSQLMIGCFCEALSSEITVDEDELEDVQWFPLEKVRQGVALARKLDFGSKSTEFRTAPPTAIAHQLLAYWISQQDEK
eukprot:TRINITY_DN12728_c0_g1_i1.p1 TRINITY_DN12728_c0_g1~~TRINITY_DN12728_c0_g1_i1.p1  ORF type:complete len:356 (-),score=35.14 TRINITY_DN12728_c0_g1_i1:16-1083(-)